MANVVGIVGLSLLAALVFAAAAAMQQRAAAHEGVRDRPLTLVGRLLRRRLWLAGWLTNVFGFFSQSAALRVGNIAVVQPLLTTQLLFSVPFATFKTPRRPTRRDFAGAIAVCAGLATFLQVRGAAPLDEGHANRGRLLESLPAATVFICVIGLIAVRWRQRDAAPSPEALHVAGPLAATLLGVAAGVCFAYTAAFIVLTTTDLLGPGVLATARDWPGYALAGSTAVGIVFEQQSFAVGTLPPAVAAMTITNPVISYVIGLVAFHINAPHRPSAWAGLIGAGVLVGIGVWLVAGSPTARRQV